MRPIRSLERILLITGAVLSLFYVISQIHSFVMSRAGLWSFEAHQEQVAEAASANKAVSLSKVDFALWSEKRIHAYKEALALKLETPLAVLSIPKISVEVPVFDGTDDLTLNRGAGRIAGTAGPGESGNMGVAAHRDGFFRALKDIHVGDRIQLSATNGQFVYAVEDIVIVDPKDVSVLQPRSKPSLTLVTCYPFYFVGDAPQRYIVHASLVDSNRAATSGLKSAVPTNERKDMP